MNLFEAILLSFIEGVTEFLPISSTGHLIVTSALLGISEDSFVKSFEIIIQFGAIASVLVLYWQRFLSGMAFYKKLLVAFLPAAIIGLLVKKKVDLILGSVEIVAWALILGGLIFIWSDKYFAKLNHTGKKVEDLSLKECLILGFIQCMAFIPGVSRAGASILGGLSLGMNRKEATEFSFFLAVPTLAGATFIKSLSIVGNITSDQILLLCVGVILSFVFAYAAIRFFIHLVSQSGFKYFGWYRIVLGLGILILVYRGTI